MSFFDQAYDDMSWNEICYRLPSELAVNAIKRRVNNVETLRMFFDNVGSQPSNIKPLKEHVNMIIADETAEDIMTAFEKDYEAVLFNWLNTDNREKIRDEQADKLSTKFLFNATDSTDRAGLKRILDRILEETEVNQSYLRSVLNKVDDIHFNSLIDSVLKDDRPEVRATILSGFGSSNKSLISDHQKVIGLKALAKCAPGFQVRTMGVLNVNIFSNLRPEERLKTLRKYLEYFPKFRKIQVFDPAPSKEEFDMILFAGCIEHNELVSQINKDYMEITESDLPEIKEEDV